MIKPVNRLLSWYFSKNALPYWGILVLDFLLMIFAGVLTYWLFIFRRTSSIDELMLLRTIVMYALPTFIGARMFHTYSGIVRYSSFVDLTRVFYANAVSLVIAYLMHYLVLYYPDNLFYHLAFRHILLMYVIATLLMWGMRVLVKTLYEITAIDARALRVLVYGAMESGVGLAKSIRMQSPARFNVRGFIAVDSNFSHNRVMGLRVFSPTDDIEQVINRLRIDAVLVAPMRIDDFRNATKLQDRILNAGIKIFLSQNAQEIDVKNFGLHSPAMHLKLLLVL